VPTATPHLSAIEHALTPAQLSATCGTAGRVPLALDRPFRYALLGCADGELAASIAATHTDASVWAWDRHPEAIVATRTRGHAMGLANLTVHERRSLPDVDDRPFGDHLTDIMAINGVLDAADDALRAQVMRFAGQHLRPGGLLCVSYRTTIGWSQIQPVVALMRYVAESHVGDSTGRVPHVLSLLQRLRDANAGYITKRAKVAAWLDEVFGMDHAAIERDYLRHELRPISHAGVADLAASIGCQFVGNALHDPEVELPDALDSLVAWAPTRALRETYFDLAECRAHRVDVFRFGGM
jgi:SAM-dependent methyltransferase